LRQRQFTLYDSIMWYMDAPSSAGPGSTNLQPTMGAVAAQHSTAVQHLSMQQQHSTAACFSACTDLQPTQGAAAVSTAQHAALSKSSSTAQHSMQRC
jgi:hypothetical protein